MSVSAHGVVLACAKRSILVVLEIKASSAVYKASILSSALSLQLHFFIFNTVFFLLLTQALTLIEGSVISQGRRTRSTAFW